jgi:hypothetical protein
MKHYFQETYYNYETINSISTRYGMVIAMDQREVFQARGSSKFN